MVFISNLYPQVIKTCRPLILEDEVLRALVKRFSDSISKSLSAEHVSQSTVKCNLTHVNDFPDGTERGTFIGLEFSGRIFRLVHVGLRGDRSINSISRLYEFPEQKPGGGTNKIADYVAKCVNNFIDVYDVYDKTIILGVASSFPMEQENLQDAKILNWGKDFQCNEKNLDFFKQLKCSLKKFKVLDFLTTNLLLEFTKKIYLISFIGSSTACLLSGLYKDPSVRIGLLLDETTNLTYMEKFKNMTTYTGDGLRAQTAIELDLKRFGDDGSLNFIKTDFDYQIDSASSNPGEYTFEKLIAGENLGEIARLCLYQLASSGVILNGYVSPNLNLKNKLTTVDLALMEMDDEKIFTRCRAVMANLGYKKVSDSDCIQIRFVSRCVARRSSNLVAALLTAMIRRIESRSVRIIGDGMLLKEFPNYEYYLVKKINQLKNPEDQYLIIKADKEDIGIGAGLVAHIYREGYIKIEDKQRALPPFNMNKYKMINMPAACIDCDNNMIKVWNREKEREKKKVFNTDSQKLLEAFTSLSSYSSKTSQLS